MAGGCEGQTIQEGNMFFSFHRALRTTFVASWPD
jgi:hypothetical protein